MKFEKGINRDSKGPLNSKKGGGKVWATKISRKKRGLGGNLQMESKGGKGSTGKEAVAAWVLGYHYGAATPSEKRLVKGARWGRGTAHDRLGDR